MSTPHQFPCRPSASDYASRVLHLQSRTGTPSAHGELQMQPEIIAGLFGLGSTILTGLFSYHRKSRQRLEEKLRRAQADVAYLLEVERLHCEKNRELRHASFKTRVRTEASKNGFTWSGAFTPGRVRASTSGFRPSLTSTVGAHLIVLGKHCAVAVMASAEWLASRCRHVVRAARREHSKPVDAKATT